MTYAIYPIAFRSTSRNPHENGIYIALQYGAGKRNRTSDLRITNALLYQLSYSGEYLILKHALLRRQTEGNAVYKKRSNNLRLCLSN